MKEATRDTTFDILKGICIICVVLAHTFNPLRRWIDIFHMPMFFLIAGYFFNHNEADSTFIFKKSKRLIVPYFITCILMIPFIGKQENTQYICSFKEWFIATFYGSVSMREIHCLKFDFVVKEFQQFGFYPLCGAG